MHLFLRQKGFQKTKWLSELVQQHLESVNFVWRWEILQKYLCMYVCMYVYDMIICVFVCMCHLHAYVCMSSCFGMYYKD